MKKILRRVVGVDVAKNKLDCSYGVIYDDITTEILNYEQFDNTTAGYKALVSFAKIAFKSTSNIRYVMEATGVYHETLAYYLSNKNLDLSVVLPTKTKHFGQTLLIKTVTDKSASQTIALYGLTQTLAPWIKPAPVYQRLLQLTRERSQNIEMRTQAKNMLHAESHQAIPDPNCIKRQQKLIAHFDKIEIEIEGEIIKLVDAHAELKEATELLITIPGIKMITATSILAETKGFKNIINKKQLVSYAGLDVVEKQSGTSVKGISKISKRGNKYLRAALYFPSLTSKKCNKLHKNLFERVHTKTGIKMKGVVAVQRKLLELAYTIVKNKTPFDKDYETKKAELKKETKVEVEMA